MGREFDKLKEKLLYHYIYKVYTKQAFSTLLSKNLFLLENKLLVDYYHILMEVMYMNQINLELLMSEFVRLEKNMKPFLLEDIEVAVFCVTENVVIERRALKNYFALVSRFKRGILNLEFIDSFKRKNNQYIQDMQYNANEFISFYDEENNFCLEKN